MKSALFNKIYTYLIRYIQIQLFLSLVSLPIFLTWGLPLSIISPLSNLLLTPILMVFLLLSTLIFLCELVCIPSTLFVFLLEYVSSFWMSILQISHNKLLYGFIQPSFFLLFLIPVVTLIIMHLRASANILKNITLLSCVVFGVIGYLSIAKLMASGSETICKKNKVSLIYEGGHSALIFGSSLNKVSDSWIAYTLIPILYKKTGGKTVDYLLFFKPISEKNKKIIEAKIPCRKGSFVMNAVVFQPFTIELTSKTKILVSQKNTLSTPSYKVLIDHE